MVGANKREVSETEGRIWAAEKGFRYFETSALTGNGVDEMFMVRREKYTTQSNLAYPCNLTKKTFLKLRTHNASPMYIVCACYIEPGNRPPENYNLIFSQPLQWL